MTKDSEIELRFRALANALASTLDDVLNPNGEKENGFVLLIFPFGGPEGQRVNYISNGQRADILSTLKEVIARFEGQPDVKGSA